MSEYVFRMSNHMRHTLRQFNSRTNEESKEDVADDVGRVAERGETFSNKVFLGCLGTINNRRPQTKKGELNNEHKVHAKVSNVSDTYFRATSY